MPTAIFNAASASAELITLPNSDSEIIFEAVRRLVPPYFDSNKKFPSSLPKAVAVSTPSAMALIPSSLYVTDFSNE